MAAGRFGRPVFLISTADERFWRCDGPVLLMGEWCRTYAKRDFWREHPHEVLPYHWDDRAKVARDYAYLDRLYERTLASLAETLNRIHGTSHSLRYWRIVLGPWWSLLLTVLFDRYETFATAVNSGKATATLAGRYEPRAWLPADIRPFLRWLNDNDAYNQYIYSRLVETVGGIPYETIDVSDSVPGPMRPAPTRRRALEAGMWNATLKLPSRFTRIALVDSSLSSKDQMRLQMQLGQAPTLRPPDIEAPPVRIDDARRRLAAESIRPAAPFEAFVSRMLPEQMPSAYLENYAEMVSRARAAYPRRPRVIFTAVAYEAVEGFKFWAAENVERGAKLVGTQHGCHFGTARFIETEDHQRRIYDRFYSWGWTDPGDPSVVPLAAAKLNRATAVRSNPAGPIVLAAIAWPRYAYRLYSVPIGASGTLSHLEEQFRFAEALPAEVRAVLMVRTFPSDRGWQQRDRWAERCPDVRCDPGGVKFLDRLRAARLLVCNAASTTMLESFAANYPTVLYLNPEQFELRADAQPYFDALRDAGILHDSTEAAAATVAKIWRDPDAWWRDAGVQRGRAQFAARFASTHPHWRRDWTRALRALAREAGERPAGRVTTGAIAGSEQR
jgi:putative transferase (TIGR04331 family)